MYCWSMIGPIASFSARGRTAPEPRTRVALSFSFASGAAGLKGAVRVQNAGQGRERCMSSQCIPISAQP